MLPVWLMLNSFALRLSHIESTAGWRLLWLPSPPPQSSSWMFPLLWARLTLQRLVSRRNCFSLPSKHHHSSQFGLVVMPLGSKMSGRDWPGGGSCELTLPPPSSSQPPPDFWDLLPKLLIVLIFKRKTWWFYSHTRASCCFIKLWVLSG